MLFYNTSEALRVKYVGHSSAAQIPRKICPQITMYHNTILDCSSGLLSVICQQFLAFLKILRGDLI